MADIVLAPFSNSDIRDWPTPHFVRLIELLLDRRPDSVIHVIGTKSQTLRANEIVRSSPSNRVVNHCGRLSWAEAQARIAASDCVVGNNSGITHVAGRLGVPTVCVFGGAHPRGEWRPLGFNVVLVSRAVGCAPCMRHRAADCPYSLDCLQQITPEAVCEAVTSIMAHASTMNRLLLSPPSTEAAPHSVREQIAL